MRRKVRACIFPEGNVVGSLPVPPITPNVKNSAGARKNAEKTGDELAFVQLLLGFRTKIPSNYIGTECTKQLVTI